MDIEIIALASTASALLSFTAGVLWGRGTVDERRLFTPYLPPGTGGVVIEHVHERDCIVNGEWACQACQNNGVLTLMPREEKP